MYAIQKNLNSRGDGDEPIVNLRSRVKDAVSYHLSRSPQSRTPVEELSSENILLSYSANQSERLRYIRDKSLTRSGKKIPPVSNDSSLYMSGCVTGSTRKARQVAVDRVVRSKITELHQLIDTETRKLQAIEEEIRRYENMISLKQPKRLLDKNEGIDFNDYELEEAIPDPTEISGAQFEVARSTSAASEDSSEDERARMSLPRSPSTTLITCSGTSTKSRRSYTSNTHHACKLPLPIKINSNSYYIRMLKGKT
jgi:hypothetical protein